MNPAVEKFKDYVLDMCLEVHERDSIAWFEGYAHGLHEAEALSDEELSECIKYVSRISRILNR